MRVIIMMRHGLTSSVMSVIIIMGYGLTSPTPG